MSHTRTYTGESEANALIEWLNQTPRGYRQVEQLLTELAQLGEALDALAAADLQSRRRRANPEALRTFKQSTRRVQRILDGYRFRPNVMGGGGPQSICAFTWSGNRPGWEAVLRIMELGERGLLWRVRRCRQCGKWFYARLRHKHFCSVRCQQAHYKSSAEWREHRREYMQRYRESNFSARPR